MYCAGLFSFGYLILNYTEITLRGGYFLPVDYFVASVGVIICFEMARRVVGNLAALAGVFFLYNFAGEWIPGAFGHTGFSWDRVVEHMFWGSQGLLGVGVGVSATYIFLFVLFGAFLKYSGFSDFINDLALTLVGRTAGGPAKVSVVASALMGMINGSALANVATTGAITIPLMKKTGYKPEFAAAVEAVASTGGQFAPPIMGAVGFIMAEFLGVPYTKVMLAAAIPGRSCIISRCSWRVHFEGPAISASRGFPRAHPGGGKVLRERGHLFIPLIVLLWLMFDGYTPCSRRRLPSSPPSGLHGCLPSSGCCGRKQPAPSPSSCCLPSSEVWPSLGSSALARRSSRLCACSLPRGVRLGTA